MKKKLVPDGYSHEECAKDMEAGLNYLGKTGDPELDIPLSKGVLVMFLCPACTHDGHPHMLSAVKKDGRFVVHG